MCIFSLQNPRKAFNCAGFCQAFVRTIVPWRKTLWRPLSWLLFCLRLVPSCSFKRKTAIFCDRCETFAGVTDGEKSSDVKWRIWSGRLARWQARAACSGAGKVPAVLRCRPLTLICLFLPGIHLLLSHGAQQRTPSCALHKAQLLNKWRLQAGGIPAAGVSQRRQKWKRVNASFWGRCKGKGWKGELGW